MSEFTKFAVTLNLFQGPSGDQEQVQKEEWMLKQVQHDDVSGGAE